MHKTNCICTGLAVALLAVSPALAGPWCDNAEGTGMFTTNGVTFNIRGGQVNMSGATLFVDFFDFPGATNDWIDADLDGVRGYNPAYINGNPNFPGFPKWDPYYMELRTSDQLAQNFNPPYTGGDVFDTWWTFQYRSVGSVNGLKEFISSQLTGAVPTKLTAEGAVFNRYQYNDRSGDAVPTGGAYTPANASFTPLQQCSIDGAFLDVPGLWGTIGADGTPSWRAKPGSAGYGQNPGTSSTGWGNLLASYFIDVNTNGQVDDGETLNTDRNNPDEYTVFDYGAAWVPVSIIANHGTGLTHISYSEAQWLFLTGRLPNGENLVACVRDAGSGTRNAAMNSLGIDPSWGRGDNVGSKIDNDLTDKAGPYYQPANRGGSSRMEGVVQNGRLAVGYTGLAGGSRSAIDAHDGKYEILDVCKDVDDQGNVILDCSTYGYVRPNIYTSLFNCDSQTGYQIAGTGSFVVRGNRDANRRTCAECSTTGFACVNDGHCRSCSISGEPCYYDSDCAPDGGICEQDGQTCEPVLYCNGYGETCTDAGDCMGHCRETQEPCTNNGDCFYAFAGDECIASTCEACAADPDWVPPHKGEQIANQAVADYLNNLLDSVADFSDSPLTGQCIRSSVCVDTNGMSTGVNCSTNGLADCLAGESCEPLACDFTSDCDLFADDRCLYDDNSPGQILATSFFMLESINCAHSFTAPLDFSSTGVNVTLRDYVLANNDLGWGSPWVGAPNYGTPPFDEGKNLAGRSPQRFSLPAGGLRFTPPYPAWPCETYTDGLSGGGSQGYYLNGGFLADGSNSLPARHELTGDIDNDGDRDVADCKELVKAWYRPRHWAMTADGVDAVPEILGDYNADGNLTKEDLRYCMDGLAMSNGFLDRAAGALAIDEGIAELGECSGNGWPCFADGECPMGQTCNSLNLSYPWADGRTSLYIDETGIECLGNDPTTHEPLWGEPADIADFHSTGVAYEPGDFMCDVAGRPASPMHCNLTGDLCTTDADCITSDPYNNNRCVSETYPIAGAQPVGWDGKVGYADIDYCCSNIVSGGYTIDNAIASDLSCDMNGDLDVTMADVLVIVEGCLETQQGDANLDGAVNATDLAIVDATIALGGAGCNGDSSCGWANGDFNCDGIVDSVDRGFIATTPPIVDEAWSFGYHGGTVDSDLGIEVFPGGSMHEPRQIDAAATRLYLNVDLDKDIATAAVTTDPVVAGALATVDGNGNVVITFPVDAPADETCYNIDLAGSVATDGGIEAAGVDFCVCYNEGDVDRSGAVNAGDRNLVVGAQNFFLDANVAADLTADVDRSGSINAGDRNLVVGAQNFFHAPTACP